jgi:Ca2+-binding RTX toxin-like protein
MRVDTGPSAGDIVTIRGGTGPDVVLLRRSEVNLDPAPDDEPDIRLVHMHDVGTDDESFVYMDTLRVFSGAGGDTVRLASRGPGAPYSTRVEAGSGDDTVVVWSSLAYGDRGDDTMRDLHAADLYGGPGDDRFVAGPRATYSSAHGGIGADALIGGAGHDDFAGGRGRDILLGFDGGDSLYGGSGPDRLAGAAGHDILYGNDGDDDLVGGGAPDRLRGGAGRDRCDADPADVEVHGCAGPPLSG